MRKEDDVKLGINPQLAFRLSPKRGAFSQRGRYPDLQVIAFRSLPIPDGTVALIAKDSLLTVAGPCGIYTRFPFIYRYSDRNLEASSSYHDDLRRVHRASSRHRLEGYRTPRS